MTPTATRMMVPTKRLWNLLAIKLPLITYSLIANAPIPHLRYGMSLRPTQHRLKQRCLMHSQTLQPVFELNLPLR